MTPRQLLVVVTWSALAAGCGGGADAAGEAAAPVRQTSTTASSELTGNDAGSPASRSAPNGPEGSTQAQKGAATESPPETFPPPDFVVKISLASACVEPGESQTITLDIGRRGGVVYQAIYADGKDGTKPGYHGGNNSGETDTAGVWRDTWVVGDKAPPGRVEVTALAIDGENRTGEGKATFEVAGAGGRCA